MADDLDAMLQGEDQPPASQAQTEGQDAGSQEPSPEEVEFNSLPGSTQDRIKKLARDKRELAEKLAAVESRTVPPAPTNYQTQTLEQKAALEQLAAVGVSTDEKVDKKLDERLNQLRWETEMGRLESKYDGSKGEPQFVREEVEDYMKSHPQYLGYQPEDVFRIKMFHDEFSNLERQQGSTKTGQTSTLRPNKASVQETKLSPEEINAKLGDESVPMEQRLQWYEENLDKINASVGSMTPPQQ